LRSCKKKAAPVSRGSHIDHTWERSPSPTGSR
jgi:hypothetical protein